MSAMGCATEPTTAPAGRTAPTGPHLVRRLCQLYAGLVGYGVSLALMVEARLGLGPWDVLHQGIAKRVDVQIGWVVIAVGAVVMLAWIPLRVRPGIGTVSNIILVGLAVNVALDVLPSPRAMAVRVTFLVAGIFVNGFATGLYIGAGLGPGPRDGLMTGLALRGMSIRLARTAIEFTVLVVGFLLGGSVGVGTVAYALLIGPLAHTFLPKLTVAAAPVETAAPEEVGP